MNPRFSVRIVLILFIIHYSLFTTSCGKKKGLSKTKPPTTISKKTVILDKYSKLIGVSVDNEILYSFIDQWIGTPYKYAGKTHSGIDCSNFSCELLRSVYSFPSSYYFPSAKLAEQGKKINISEAQEGDLVLFAMNQNSKISHVGIYLGNSKFVHASTSKGVMISSLKEDYYAKRLSFLTRIVI